MFTIARPVKCPQCEEYFDRDEVEFTTKNGRYYHKNCAEAQSKQAQQYKNLIEYICKIRNLKAPTPFMTRQIQRFKEELNYTYGGMLMTLIYYHEVLGKPVIHDTKVGVGIIEYTYRDAENYYKELHTAIKHNKEAAFQMKEDTVTIKLSDRHKVNKKKLLNMEDIL